MRIASLLLFATTAWSGELEGLVKQLGGPRAVEYEIPRFGERAVPLLIPLIENRDAIRALAMIGPQASVAVPALRKAFAKPALRLDAATARIEGG